MTAETGVNSAGGRVSSGSAPAVIISGPSGIGKSTVIEQLLKSCAFPLRHSVSATTRSPRHYEIPGVHYHYWTKERFERGIANDEFLEWAIVHGRDYYGTLVAEVAPHLEAGTGVILEIDVQGAAQVRQKLPEVFSVFLSAPEGVYESRLRNRGTESEEAIQRRLHTAREEALRIPEYSLNLVNDDLDGTVERIRRAIEPLFHPKPVQCL